MSQTTFSSACPPRMMRPQPSRSRGADRFWPVLRDLIEARNVFGLRRSVLATLRALISFVEEGSVVFASNRSIAARAEGISESALRRHIKTLVDLGFLQRRDSSNGKRYRLEAEGQPDMVFGLDLAPLEAAGERISVAAEQSREQNRMIRYLRKRLGQLIYLAKTQGRLETEMQPYQNALRQKLSPQAYETLCEELSAGDLTSVVMDEIGPEKAIAAKMTGSDSQIGCHKNISEERFLKDKGSCENPEASGSDPVTQRQKADEQHYTPEQDRVVLLRKAKSLTPDALEFAEKPLESWTEVEGLAWRLASWTGITPRLLAQAVAARGTETAAMAVLFVTQNAARIRNPGAYFRSLTLGPACFRFSGPSFALN